jgi:hypothetical protein
MGCQFVPPPGDHQKCYKLRPLERFPQRTVTLADQFGVTNTTVLRPTRFCNPADKNDEGVEDPGAHLQCYSIKDAEGFTRRDVEVTNQFGTQRLTVRHPELLCNPAVKNGEAQLDTLNTNHYKCYRATRTKGAPQFGQVDVTLLDQFEPVDNVATVLRPILLCNPVDKNGEGIVDPTLHLTCFAIKDPFDPPGIIVIEDQFAVQDGFPRTGDCRRSRTLCVPSYKIELSPSGAFIETGRSVLE